mgnify:CR=1 FL=1
MRRKELRESDAKHQRELNVTGFPDGHRAVAPPEPMPNSEVKRSIADGSVGLPHVRVGHCQVLIQSLRETGGFFLFYVKEYVTMLALSEREHHFIH